MVRPTAIIAILILWSAAIAPAKGSERCFGDAAVEFEVKPAAVLQAQGLDMPEAIAWLDREAVLKHVTGRLIDAQAMKKSTHPEWATGPLTDAIDNLIFDLSPRLHIRLTYLPTIDAPSLGRVYSGYIESFFVEWVTRSKDGKCDASLQNSFAVPTGGASIAYWGTATQVRDMVSQVVDEFTENFLTWGIEIWGQCGTNTGQSAPTSN